MVGWFDIAKVFFPSHFFTLFTLKLENIYLYFIRGSNLNFKPKMEKFSTGSVSNEFFETYTSKVIAKFSRSA